MSLEQRAWKIASTEGNMLSRRAFVGVVASAAGALITGPNALADGRNVDNQRSMITEYKAKDFSEVAKGLKGISSNQLAQHIGLYEGYVKKTNAAQKGLRKLHTADKAFASTSTRDLSLRQTYSLNGMILHEYYFAGLTAERSVPAGNVADILEKEHGGVQKWFQALISLGKAARGWVVFGLNLRDGHTHFYVLDAHDMYSPLLVIPLVVLDVYEHAYMIDYGTNRGAYLDAYAQLINWSVVTARINRLEHVSTGRIWTD